MFLSPIGRGLERMVLTVRSTSSGVSCRVVLSGFASLQNWTMWPVSGSGASTVQYRTVQYSTVQYSTISVCK